MIDEIDAVALDGLPAGWPAAARLMAVREGWRPHLVMPALHVLQQLLPQVLERALECTLIDLMAAAIAAWPSFLIRRWAARWSTPN